MDVGLQSTNIFAAENDVVLLVTGAWNGRCIVVRISWCCFVGWGKLSEAKRRPTNSGNREQGTGSKEQKDNGGRVQALACTLRVRDTKIGPKVFLCFLCTCFGESGSHFPSSRREVWPISEHRSLDLRDVPEFDGPVLASRRGRQSEEVRRRTRATTMRKTTSTSNDLSGIESQNGQGTRRITHLSVSFAACSVRFEGFPVLRTKSLLR